MKYNRDYFIKKFEAIPDEQWICGDYFNEEKNACCALGHCGVNRVTPSNEGYALNKLLNQSVTLINDGVGKNFRSLGDTPKERILNALKAIQ